jgi:hypothetical protein
MARLAPEYIVALANSGSPYGRAALSTRFFMHSYYSGPGNNLLFAIT